MSRFLIPATMAAMVALAGAGHAATIGFTEGSRDQVVGTDATGVDVDPSEPGRQLGTILAGTIFNLHGRIRQSLDVFEFDFTATSSFSIRFNFDGYETIDTVDDSVAAGVFTGAILVGVATALGLVSAPAEQIVLFAVFSVAALLLAREKIKVWFRGNVSDRWDGDTDLIATRGERVTVTRTFSEGVGHVRLSGAEWKAECEDGQLAEGDTAWVVGHRGITLIVSETRPETDHS